MTVEIYRDFIQAVIITIVVVGLYIGFSVKLIIKVDKLRRKLK